jgi:hypothetical protein
MHLHVPRLSAVNTDSGVLQQAFDNDSRTPPSGYVVPSGILISME